MAQYGLGNFVYEVVVKDGAAHFNFFDPDDSSNTAEVSVAKKDFPEGIVQADSRQVADVAYAQCQQVLNDKRDARLRKEADDAMKAKNETDSRAREAAADILSNGIDHTVAPHHTEDDGTNVFNTEAPKSDDKKK